MSKRCVRETHGIGIGTQIVLDRVMQVLAQLRQSPQRRPICAHQGVRQRAGQPVEGLAVQFLMAGDPQLQPRRPPAPRARQPLAGTHLPSLCVCRAVAIGLQVRGDSQGRQGHKVVVARTPLRSGPSLERRRSLGARLRGRGRRHVPTPPLPRPPPPALGGATSEAATRTPPRPLRRLLRRPSRRARRAGRRSPCSWAGLRPWSFQCCSRTARSPRCAGAGHGMRCATRLRRSFWPRYSRRGRGSSWAARSG
mmetsp:Transcript_82460/g.267106  ORF Transcript_82460/g.267106 Transcript_82460/m.267106 type:complete len:252 (-) Transcript_82460:84-839(-)